MSVFDNMAFGLKLQKVPRHDIELRVRDAARILGLDELLDRKPAALSGGQRQRVAMGRAIVRHPHAFLMDEPLSNLDAKLRVQMRAEIARIQHDLGVTTIYVTHDQIEAMTMGDRVAVIRRGMLQQVDSPQALYEHPVNLFVAGFIGSPAMNLVEATIDGGLLRFADIELPLPGGSPLAGTTRQVILGIRPTDFEHGSTADRELPRIRVKADVVEELGSESHVIFPVDAPIVTADAVRAAADAHTDDEGKLLFAGEKRTTFTARIDGKKPVAVGQELELAVDYTCLHCFDPDTGDALQTRRDRQPVA
jgi:multiple sugar transport system ATP-binding protein